MGTEKIAFRMFLNPGQADEYRRRHEAIWPELVALLHDAGISDYSIFLDAQHDVLFAVLRRSAVHRLDELPKHLMRTHADGSPVVEPLPLMFHLD